MVDYFDISATGYSRRSHTLPWSWLRGREVAAFTRLADFGESESALDLGCGAGFYAHHASRFGISRIVGVDSSQAMVDALPDPIVGMVADACSLKINEKFDIVMCAGLVEFVDDLEGVFRSARSHINENGIFIILYPRECALGLIYKAFHWSHAVTVRLFHLCALNDLANREGFRLTSAIDVWPFTGIARFAPQ